MLDEGYWRTLLRDVEEELPSVQPAAAGEEPDGGWDGAAAHQGTRRWPGTAGSVSEDDWLAAEGLLTSQALIEVKISGYNRGGLLAEFGVLQGFIPSSHLAAPVPGQSNEQRAAALAARSGETLAVRVAEIDRDRCRLILSERPARESGQVAALLTSLSAGQICRGHVTSLCPFGAFVDLGGFEGLIHISELSWGRVGLPSRWCSRGIRWKRWCLRSTPKPKRSRSA